MYADTDLLCSLLTESEVAFLVALADTDDQSVCAGEVRVAVVRDEHGQVVEFGEFPVELSVLDGDVSGVVCKKQRHPMR